MPIIKRLNTLQKERVAKRPLTESIPVEKQIVTKQTPNKKRVAIPIELSPPITETQLFYYSEKTETGFTPNRENIISQAGNYCGPSHLYLRTNTTPNQIVCGDDKSGESNDRKDWRKNYKQLIVKLAQLKQRCDKDYVIKKTSCYKDGTTINIAHAHASNRKIEECIEQYHLFLSVAPDPEAMINEINLSISNKKLYNPFGLKKIYDVNGIKLNMANDPAVCAPLLLNNHTVKKGNHTKANLTLNLSSAFDEEDLESPASSASSQKDLTCKLFSPRSIKFKPQTPRNRATDPSKEQTSEVNVKP